ncbi:hypothetical protein FE257_006518 [Aspergillus nanangensis]|uniref:CCCH zinc finger protein n=1 Tax=Aspergillus nanangensis TaxID=2582783 RepID=A0AAD4CXN6_ASPNN|nr:hypothetical protein FE257_006518 [Aspergillus nanangensis]
MTEDQDLMAKISQLAGQINRHKNQTPEPQTSFGSDPSFSGHHVARHGPSRARGWAPYRSRPYARGGRAGAAHRHRTLILNNANTGSGTPPSSTPSTAPGTDNDGEDRRSATPGKNGWVAKRDRHMQLINSAIYDKESQTRAKAMEESRKARAQKKAQVEQAKVLRYAQGVGQQPFSAPGGAVVSTTADPSAEYQVYLNDIPFRVSRGGSKLIRVSGAAFIDASFAAKRASLPFIGDATNTPKRVTVAGVTFVRSKNGNLHRLGAVTSKRHLLQRTIMSIYPRSKQGGHVQKFSPNRQFATLGYCEKGEQCDERHVHECPDYANTGVCMKKRCRLPHVDRAGQIRKNIANKPETDPQNDEESDASSEDEEYDQIDTDDVDSDELEDDEPELIAGAEGSTELAQQQDFIRF